MAACTTTTTMTMTMNISDHETSKTETIDQGTSGSSCETNTLTSESTANDAQRCFVCDVVVVGRHYALATCRTQSTRARVIEKLGELVGERYMVVISEDDVICRGCANLMNTLDRLEHEKRNVRNTILHFIERKYSLEEGELIGNSDAVKPCQPPQITKSRVQNGSTCNGKKRTAVCASELYSDDSKQKKSSNIWMQCDKCLYTTKYNSFMVHHIRQHVKQPTSCNTCGLQLTSQQSIHICKQKDYRTGTRGSISNDQAPVSSANAISVANEVKSEDLQMAAVHSESQFQDNPKEENLQLIELRSNDDLPLQDMVETADSDTPRHPLYVQVLQHVDGSDSDFLGAVNADAETDVVVKVKDGSAKQMLTLAEDGSLEVVEVASWDDVHSSHVDSDIPF